MFTAFEADWRHSGADFKLSRLQFIYSWRSWRLALINRYLRVFLLDSTRQPSSHRKDAMNAYYYDSSVRTRNLARTLEQPLLEMSQPSPMKRCPKHILAASCHRWSAASNDVIYGYCILSPRGASARTVAWMLRIRHKQCLGVLLGIFSFLGSRTCRRLPSANDCFAARVVARCVERNRNFPDDARSCITQVKHSRATLAFIFQCQLLHKFRGSRQRLGN
ncbi:hypothetical protein IWZ00DRAFT_258147 [Phyllosticta capitalensis]